MKQGTKQDECFFKDLYQKYSKQIEEKIYTLTKNTEYGQSPTNDETIQFLLDRSIENKKDINELKQEMMDISQIYKKSIWKSSFTTNFLNQLSQRGYKYLPILIYLNLIVDGYFHHTYPITKTEKLQVPYQMPFQSFFLQTIEEYKCKILFSVSVYNKMKNNQIKFNHTIVFLDIRFDEVSKESFEKLAFSYLSIVQNDPNKSINGYNIQIDSQLVVQSNTKTIIEEKFLFKYNQNTKWASLQFSNNMNNKYCKWIPTQFLNKSFMDKEYDFFEKYQQEWEKQKNTIMLQNQIIKENKAKLSQYANFKDSGVILDLIRNCQQMNKNVDQKQILKITEQERNIIGLNQNALIIGRSGTGKTTCSLLRVYSTQLLMNIKQRLFGQKNQPILINSHNNKQNVSLRFVFTTQNQVLVSEVRNYYRSLTNKIKSQLTSNENRESILDQSFASISSIAHQDINQSDYLETMSLLWCTQSNQEECEEFEQIDKIKQMTDLTDKDFPAFLTIEKLLMLIDSALETSFFTQEKYRNKKKNIQKRAGWNEAQVFKIGQNFKQNIYDVEQDGFDEFLDEQILKNDNDAFEDFSNQQQIEQDSYKMLSQSQNQIISSEVFSHNQTNQEQEEVQRQNQIILSMIDYNYFLNNFWAFIKKQCSKSLEKMDQIAIPQLIWTQIYSIIKGSQYSYLYPMSYLPLDVYEQLNQGKLSMEQLHTIYDAFLEYEKWKDENDLFDLLDLVNYLLKKQKEGKYNGVPIHYMLVDEIQDLPHAIIELLTKITEQGLFFCGDTAQTIMKGIGFRFQDIKQLFRNQVISGNNKFADVKQLQLSVNFRSHNNILQMANCLVSLIELFFPKQIDHLNQEISNIKGPKPYVIASSDTQLVIGLIQKIIAANKNSSQQIDFGCNQVIIVKDEDSKEQVSNELNHALILTIYEAKGLEFDDVILYNFFSNGISFHQWELLKYINLEDYELTAGEQVQRISKHELEQNQQTEEIDYLSQIKKLRLNPQIKAIDLTLYQNLCDELKLIYVGITRAKRSIIIYDDDPTKRQSIQELWKQMDIISLVDHESIQKINRLEMIDERAQRDSDQWKKLGIKMFANKYYDQAVKCFKNCQEQSLIDKAQAFACATQASKSYSRYIQIGNESKVTRLNKNEKVKLQSQLEEFLEESYRQFNLAGDNFLKIKSYKNAAACYFSSKKYEKALLYYLHANKILEAAECCVNLNKHSEATILYFLAEHYDECLQPICEVENAQCIILELAYYLLRNNFLESLQFQNYLEQHFKGFLEIYYSIYQEHTIFKDQINKQIKIEEQYGLLGKCRKFMQNINNLLNQKMQQKLIVFEKIMKIIEQQIQQLTFNDAYIIWFHKVFNQFEIQIFDILDIQFINYDRQKYQDAFNQGKNYQQIIKYKINFFADVLDYFQLQNIMLYVYSFYNSTQLERYYQSLIFQDQTILKYNNYFEKVQHKLNYQILSKEDLIDKHLKLLGNIKPSNLLFQIQIQLGFWQVALAINQNLYKNENNNKLYLDNVLEIAQLFKDYDQLTTYYKEIKQYNNLEMIQLEQSFMYQDLNKKQFIYDFAYLTKVSNFYKSWKKEEMIQFDMIQDALLGYSQKLLDQQEIDLDYFQISICLIVLINEINEQYEKKQSQQIYKQLFKLGKQQSELLLEFLEMGSKLFKFRINSNQQVGIFKAFCVKWFMSFPQKNISNFLGSTYVFVLDKSPILKMLNQEELQNRFIISSNHDIGLFPTQIIIKYIRQFCNKFLNRYSNDLQKNIKEQQNTEVRKSIEQFRYIDYCNIKFFLRNVYKRIFLKDLVGNFIITPKPKSQETLQNFCKLSRIYLKKMSVDTDKIKFNKHFLYSCLIMRLIHQQDQNLIMIDMLIQDIKHGGDFPISIKMLKAYKIYIAFQISFNKCFSVFAIKQFIEYDQVCKQEQIYNCINSDFIGATLCLIIQYIYQQQKEEIQEKLQGQLFQQFNEYEQFEQQQLNGKYQVTIFIPDFLEDFFDSQKYSINVSDEYQFDLTFQANQLCQIILDKFVTKRDQYIFKFLLEFIIGTLDIRFFDLEEAIERKQRNQANFNQKITEDLQELTKFLNFEFQTRRKFIEQQYKKINLTLTEIKQSELDQTLQDYAYFLPQYQDRHQFTQQLTDDIQYNEQISFTNSYYALRYLFYESMRNKLPKSYLKNYIKNEILFEQYEQIDQQRMKLFQILYAPSNITNSLKFQSIIHQITELQKQESLLDKLLQQYDNHTTQAVRTKLLNFKNEFKEWKNRNRDIRGGKFEKITKDYKTNFKKQKMYVLNRTIYG